MHKASSVGFSFEIAIFLKFSLLFNIKLQISGHIFHSSGNVHTQTLLKYYPSAFFHREKDHKNIYLCLSRNLIIDVSKKSNKYLCRQFPLQVAGKTADKKFFCWQREEFLECSIGPRRPQCHLSKVTKIRPGKSCSNWILPSRKEWKLSPSYQPLSPFCSDTQ